MLSRSSSWIGVAAVVLLCGCNSAAPTSPSTPSTGQPPAGGTLTGLELSAESVDAGQAITGTVTISQTAPAAGATVTVSIAGSAASAPASITVPGGQTSATFTITTTAVDADSDVTVTARYGDVERARSLRVRAVATSGGPLAELSAGDDDIVSGDDTSLTLKLASPAPAGGLAIRLASDTAEVSVPSSITVPAGATSVAVELKTTPVAVETEARVTATVVAVARARKGVSASTAAGQLTIVIRLLPPPADDDGDPPPDEPDPPQLSSLTPAAGTQGTTVAVTLTGAHFAAGATVAVSGAGVTVDDVVVVDADTISADFIVAPDAATGARSVSVTTSSGTSGMQTFTVDLAAPTLTTVSPANGAQGATVAVTLTGTNFVDGASIGISGTGVTADNVVVVNGTTITADLIVAGTATPGGRDVTVTTSAGTSGAQTFTVVLPPPPTLSVFPVAPNTSLDGPTIGVTITGTNFVAGATDVTVSGGITVDNIVVTSPTSLTADFGNLTTSTGTTFDVTVTTSGGSDTETVTSGAPISGPFSSEAAEDTKCVEIDLEYDHAPGSETEMSVSALPAVGTLLLFDDSQPFGQGAAVETDDVLANNTRVCFVPVAHDHSVPSCSVYASFTVTTLSRTVVGAIEQTATFDIVITPVFLPPGFCDGGDE